MKVLWAEQVILGPEMLPMLKENYEYKVTSKVKNKLLSTNVKVFDPDLVQL